MLSSFGKIIFGLVIIATFIAFALPVLHRIRIILSGLPDKRFDHLAGRIWGAFTKILFQRCTIKSERVFSGFMHVFIFYSALTFDTMTINHTLEGFFPNFYLFGNGNLGMFFSLIVDIFAILVLIGVAFFAFRRFILKPAAYQTTRLDSGIIYVLLTIVTLSYLYFEIFALAVHPEAQRLSFLGIALGKFLNISVLSSSALLSHFQIGWWAHILVVFGFIAYVPYSKYFHMFTGSFNVLVRSDRPLGELSSQDLENSEVFGTEKALDFTWKDLLDAFACMECGRCQDACPAFASEKPLSPKMVIFNLKAHILSEAKNLIGKKRDDLPSLMGRAFSEDEMWTCTTCGACMSVCPVEIEHIPKIIGVRQGQVLMESKFPQELNTFFRNMETNSNPWGIGFADRANWTEGLDVKLASDHPQAEYLFWVGCAGSFDEEGKKISRAMVSILNSAGIDFAILGAEEKCCGDSAKRLGNEYLFQILAGENIELLKKYKVKKIITICPHGYNTFKHEYPHLLDILPNISEEEKNKLRSIEVIHHVEFIHQLIKEGRIHLKKSLSSRFSYHDSCYLGRHNGILDEPRDILSTIAEERLTEFKNSKKHSFCCGAGGGLMWTEESLGTRINHMRSDEIIASGAHTVATSCPFCQQMLLDGLKDKGKETVKVEDIAQLVAASLV